MECYPHRRLAHAEMLGRLADRAPIDANRRHGGALAGCEGVEGAANLTVANGFRFRLWEAFGDLADFDLHQAAAAAKGVNELVARNCIKPWRDGRIVPPRMALHVDRKQRDRKSTRLNSSH